MLGLNADSKYSDRKLHIRKAGQVSSTAFKYKQVCPDSYQEQGR